MLTLTIPTIEIFNQVTQEFTSKKEQTLLLEHSLISISKWESKHHKPFLDNKDLSTEETIDYVRFMIVSGNEDCIKELQDTHFKQIKDYIDNPMSATVINQQVEKKKGVKEIITSELIYYWMVALSIPFECQNWHLNRLLKLINVASIKNSPPKKTGKQDLASRNKSINDARRKSMGTKG